MAYTLIQELATADLLLDQPSNVILQPDSYVMLIRTKPLLCAAQKRVNITTAKKKMNEPVCVTLILDPLLLAENWEHPLNPVNWEHPLNPVDLRLAPSKRD